MAFFPLLPVDFDTELQRMDQTIQQFERMFGNISPSKALSASRFGKQLMSLQAPNIDMSENDKEVIIKADLPGLEEKDVQLEYKDGNLIISGQKEMSEEREEKGVRFRERSRGSFYRVIALPSPVEEEKIKATSKNGVLTVMLPKSPNVEKNRKLIPIQKE